MKNNLYKFMPFNQNLFSLLINGEFWLGSPDMLNDPFEGDFRINNIHNYHNKIFIEKLLKFKRKNFIDDFTFEEQFEKSVSDKNYFYNILYDYVNQLIKDKYGVSSFTRNPNNFKMWSHYSDSHKGICVVFDEIKLKQCISRKLNIYLKEIRYCKYLPVINIVNHDRDENGDDYVGIDNEAMESLTHKLRNWEDEKEVRLILDQDFNVFPNRKIKFDKSCIKGILFGARMPEEEISTILKLMSMFSLKQEVTFMHAHKDLQKPDIVFHPLKF